MNESWKDSIYRQREELAQMLREPMDKIAEGCAAQWDEREKLEQILVEGFGSISYCAYLYVLDTNGIQVTESLSRSGIAPGHFRRDRSKRPYMKEVVPAWGGLGFPVVRCLYQPVWPPSIVDRIADYSGWQCRSRLSGRGF